MVVFSLTLVRHGETLYNRKKILQGQTDVPLSQVGIQQAKMAANRLENENFTHVFSSDLSRANQTAQVIMEGNSVCHSTVVTDKRLRERKFGTLEGKSHKELIAAAKKANTNVASYTPPGAETNLQMQERAMSFFRDLCKLLVAFMNETEDTEYTPGSIKQRHGGSLGRNSGNIRNRLVSSRRSQSFCGIASMSDAPDLDIYNDYQSSDQKRRKYEKDHDTSDDPEDSPCHNSSSSVTVAAANHSVRSQYTNGGLCSSQDENLTDTVIGRSNSSSSSGYSSLPDGTDLSDKDSEDQGEREDQSETKKASQENLFTPSSYLELNCESSDNFSNSENEQLSDSPADTKPDTDQTNNYSVSSETFITGPSVVNRSPAGGYCPNVSLSPLLAHRLSSVSSISSGRNSSFDDMDGMPPTVADVLIVSHGGFIKEMIRHFVENLGCKIPGGKSHALKVCANCSLSKFTVTVHNVSESPTVSCITINERDHLREVDVTEFDLAL
ncbi:uncharacterized protein LOC132549755 [Ylistrum balloti]|uniref:uncharacterized protein LOC132549755 n=1 Tax=Ylistrum balloti TaxID=509963 RepID=UPI0029058549|nr:uncharacterized protein LOC132549755 [Ylistrum balloti]